MPGAKSSSLQQPQYQNIQQELGSGPKLISRKNAVALNVEAKQGWWKQNYKYKR
jgi:hypothetical protein